MTRIASLALLITLATVTTAQAQVEDWEGTVEGFVRSVVVHTDGTDRITDVTLVQEDGTTNVFRYRERSGDTHYEHASHIQPGRGAWLHKHYAKQRSDEYGLISIYINESGIIENECRSQHYRSQHDESQEACIIRLENALAADE